MIRHRLNTLRIGAQHTQYTKMHKEKQIDISYINVYYNRKNKERGVRNAGN